MIPVALCHPTDLGISEFSEYDLVIDARSSTEYDEDHIPGSICGDTLSEADELRVRAELIKGSDAANQLALELSTKKIRSLVPTIVKKKDYEQRALVYCNRGDGRSTLWVNELKRNGFVVESLIGGYCNYRDWVRAAVERLPKVFKYNVISGSSGCDKRKILGLIAEDGAQALDLVGMAVEHGGIRGPSSGSRKLFESILVDRLRKMDTKHPIWMERLGSLGYLALLPTSMRKCVEQPSLMCMLSAPPQERAKTWRSRYRDLLQSQPSQLVDLVARKVGNLDSQLADELRQLAAQSHTDEMLQRLLKEHYDAHYAKSMMDVQGRLKNVMQISMDTIDEDSLRSVARGLIAISRH